MKRKRNYSKDDITKYSQIEYINTNLYHDIITRYINEIGEVIPREVLDYEEIFKDVDLVSPKGFSFLTLSTPPLHEINIPSSLTCITCPGETRLTTDSMVEPYKHNSRPLK